MADTQVKQRFDAAVNVIRGLPKNGSYQPSNEMMLRFYAYFKQATLGPCTQKKPAFWDVVSRAKWDAYKALGKMTQEQAMHLYVEDLKKIIETMSYTDNVAEFMGSINDVEGINVTDLEAIAPNLVKSVKSNSPIIESREISQIKKSQPQSTMNNGGGAGNKYYENGHGKLNGNHSPSSTSSSISSISPLTSTTTTKDNLMNANNANNNNSNNSNFNNNNVNHQNGYSTDHSDDEFIDTVEDDTILLNEQPQQNSKLSNGHYEYNSDRNRISNDDRNNLHNSINNLAASTTNNHYNNNNNNNNNNNHNNHNNRNNNNMMMMTNNGSNNGKSGSSNPVEIQSALSQILRTVNQMNADINNIQNRIGTIEKSLIEVKNHQLRKKVNINININILNYSNKKRSKKSKIMQLQQQYPKWWPFAEISPNWFIILIVWPFVIRRIIQMMERKK